MSAPLSRYAEDLTCAQSLVVAAIPTQANPRRLGPSGDGKVLVVSNYLSDSLTVIDAEKLKVVKHVPLGGWAPDAARRGEILFNSGETDLPGPVHLRELPSQRRRGRPQLGPDPRRHRQLQEHQVPAGRQGHRPLRLAGHQSHARRPHPRHAANPSPLRAERRGGERSGGVPAIAARIRRVSA